MQRDIVTRKSCWKVNTPARSRILHSCWWNQSTRRLCCRSVPPLRSNSESSCLSSTLLNKLQVSRPLLLSPLLIVTVCCTRGRQPHTALVSCRFDGRLDVVSRGKPLCDARRSSARFTQPIAARRWQQRSGCAAGLTKDSAYSTPSTDGWSCGQRRSAVPVYRTCIARAPD